MDISRADNSHARLAPHASACVWIYAPHFPGAQWTPPIFGTAVFVYGSERRPPVLATADVGIGISAGTQVAVEAGDVVLVRSDPRDVPRIIGLSRASYRKMLQNLWWEAGYNIFAIPLAAGALASRGIILSPAMVAVLMSASTVIVAINAQLLRRAPITTAIQVKKRNSSDTSRHP